LIEDHLGRRPAFEWIQSKGTVWSAECRAKAWPISHELALETASYLCDEAQELWGGDFSKDFTGVRENLSNYPHDRFAITLVCSFDVEDGEYRQKMMKRFAKILIR
jgi:hypothetical protein